MRPETARQLDIALQERPRGRLRFAATGLLVAMVAVFLAARLFEPDYPALAWVRAFAEAATIGALADWFAVTAVFRHPMGLPIPHTAIVPRNKDRIGRNLAEFVEQNFLAPTVVRDRIADIDFVQAFGDWLAEGDRPRKLAERLAGHVPALLGQFDEAEVQRYLLANVKEQLRRLELAPIAGEILAAFTANGRHHPLIDQLIDELARLLAEYEPAIRAKVREKTAWLWRSMRADVAISDRIIAAAEDVLDEMSHDLQHPWRKKFDAVLAQLADDLRTSGNYRHRLDALRVELLEHPALRDYVANVWNDVRAAIVADVARDDSLTARQLERVIVAFAAALRGDDAARTPLNRWLRSAIAKVVEAQRHEIGHLIAETIRRWDAETFTRRIEAYVGDDLQFIRINGTVIGGMIGLALHAASRLL